VTAYLSVCSDNNKITSDTGISQACYFDTVYRSNSKLCVIGQSSRSQKEDPVAVTGDVMTSLTYAAASDLQRSFKRVMIVKI